MAAFGASDAWQGGGMVIDAVHGISSEGFNPIKNGFQAEWPEWGAVFYEGTSFGFNVTAIGAKVPLVLGATDGIERVRSMFGVTVSRWDNARVVLGNVVSQSVNQLILTGSAIGKAFGFVREVNGVVSGP
jgi:filamentous hemagglutinin